MGITRKLIGQSTGHASQRPLPVDSITLNHSELEISVWTYGATLVEAFVPDRHGQRVNVVKRLSSLTDYEDRTHNQYVGATLGRYARCIENGYFEIRNQRHHVDCNLNGHHFHGGTIGFDRFVWDAEVEERGDELRVCLRLQSPDGDQGYPGSLTAETRYIVRNGGQLIIEHEATTTADTIVALTNHAYWNLSGKGIIDEHYLTINAGRYVPCDQHHIPRGPLAPLSGTALDYSFPKRVLGQAIDHCFVLNHAENDAESDAEAEVTLEDPVSGRVMRLTTDQPGLAVYSGDGLTPARSGICLQTGALPNSPNRPDFPNSLITRGQVYRHHTTYTFSAH
jgi:aldose 1-epimerase